MEPAIVTVVVIAGPLPVADSLGDIAGGAFLAAGGEGTRDGVGAHGRRGRTGGGGGFGLVKAGWERCMLLGMDSGNYWNGFRMADRVAPAGVPFYLFTTGLARRFAGERPSTDREVHWEVYTPVDSARRWIQAAWIMPGDSIRVLEGGSRATGSSWFAAPVAAKDGIENGFRVLQRDGRWTVALDSQAAVMVDTSVLRVTVFADPVYPAGAGLPVCGGGAKGVAAVYAAKDAGVGWWGERWGLAVLVVGAALACHAGVYSYLILCAGESEGGGYPGRGDRMDERSGGAG